MAKAAVAGRSASRKDDIVDCPVTDPRVERELKVCVQASYALSKGVLTFLESHTPEAKALWLKRAVDSSRVIFQPWTMELLFVLAVLGRTRFGELQKLLGISSRTLSDKLQALREEGLVEREVFDEQPVRIEYRLTKQGRDAAALATPLFGHLNTRVNAAP
jgi:DNA-binding HxlR family transcriptional regulator